MKNATDQSEEPGRSIARQVQQDFADVHYLYEVKFHDEGSFKRCVKRGSLEAE